MGIPGDSTTRTLVPLGPGKFRTVFLMVLAKVDPGVVGTAKNQWV